MTDPGNWMLDEVVRLTQRNEQMFATMRDMRDRLRDPSDRLGSAHTPETRAAMAHMLDWYIRFWEEKKS